MRRGGWASAHAVWSASETSLTSRWSSVEATCAAELSFVTTVSWSWPCIVTYWKSGRRFTSSRTRPVTLTTRATDRGFDDENATPTSLGRSALKMPQKSAGMTPAGPVTLAT
jgi:hypothetical protein